MSDESELSGEPTALNTNPLPPAPLAPAFPPANTGWSMTFFELVRAIRDITIFDPFDLNNDNNNEAGIKL